MEAKNNMETKKDLGYAYPTSTRAQRLGFNETGCHYVTVLLYPKGKTMSEKGFLLKKDAVAYGETLKMEWTKYSMI